MSYPVNDLTASATQTALAMTIPTETSGENRLLTSHLASLRVAALVAEGGARDDTLTAVCLATRARRGELYVATRGALVAVPGLSGIPKASRLRW
jgi:hypothetical protein